ncbi:MULTISPECIES: histidine kinase [Corynebacterium]|jgi:two component system sensor kinase|uniref:sensor histidine kinase n=1 Tax=Corynebacterium TaxID=1716 RepID=UPI001EF55B1C|nr:MULTISPECIES: histidine kinase [Corynebacterium]MCG7243042.1 histidine kinase [Corynebacterium sp. ACRPS]MCG7271703.1 histidine kinase [Corynebacterium sp. ACRQM]MCG7233910.1 histidine kinase [Corynebacterium sp. ACRPR]MDK8473954.1 histidine kinase [Corynebacterium sp. MSK078]MDK8659068.1 histidine kinase [Corynebacterium sp. MSK204]
MSTDTVAKARLGDKILTAAAALMALFYLIGAWAAPGAIELIQAALSLLFLPFIWVWRTKPVLSAAGFIVLLGAWAAAWISQLPANLGVTPWAMTAPMAVYATSRYVERRSIPRAVLTAAFLGSFISPAMWRIDPESFLLSFQLDRRYITLLVVHWAVLGSAYFIAARYFDLDRQRERLAQERFHQAQEEERLLIARELHDVLAHSLTLIKVQANAGIIAARTDTTAAEDTLKSIRDGADSALEEVRGIVTALRSTGPAALEPAHQLEHVQGIIDGFRTAGLEVDAELPASYEVSALTQLALVRIISEGLTNALRHQGPGTHVQLKLTLSDAARVTLTSTASSPTPSEVSGSGVGLVGVKERAQALGGHLTSSGDAQKFTLAAELPLHKDNHA